MRIYPKLPVELYACYGGHGIFNEDPETDPRSLYRIQKAVCFFNRARNGDQKQTFVRTNQQEEDITYNYLDSLSPVNCNVTNSKSAIALSANPANNSGNQTVELMLSPNRETPQATLFVNCKFKEMSIMLTGPDERILWRKENTRE